MVTPLNTLKNWFQNGLKPIQEQFWAWMNSYYHKDEPIPMGNIDGLSEAIGNKADTDVVSNGLDGKVDKVVGKGLSTNDFTDDDKNDITSANVRSIANATSISELESSKLGVSDIVDNLTSLASDKVLSANQGRVLKQFINNINAILASDDTTLDEIQEIVDYIIQNRDDLQNLSVSNIAGLQTALDGKEDTFSKNTAFNKNFGTSSGTVMQGNDSRVVNGQTAFTWGNHASAGYLTSLPSHTHSWSQITGKPTTFTPSSHNHDDRYYTETESDSRFAPISHSHSWGSITGKPTTFSPSAHTHSWIEITGRPTTFTPSTHNHDDRYYTESESNGRFLRSNANDTASGNINFTGGLTVENGGSFPQIVFRTAGSNRLLFRAGNELRWRFDGTNDANIWHSRNDGSGSGLDADLLDGLNSTSFLRSDISDRFTGNTLTIDKELACSNIVFKTPDELGNVVLSYEDGYLRFRRGGGGTINGWRWDNFDTEVMSLNTLGDLTLGGHLEFSGTNGIRRYSHNSGCLVGSNNNVGSNASKTNPIYIIGHNHFPTEDSLIDMYGIGFSNSSAGFLDSTDLGSIPSGWGMYVAADGNARIFLSGQNGNGYFGGSIFTDDGNFRGRITASSTVTAANFILSSDIRHKDNIKNIPTHNQVNIDWRTFTLKSNKEDLRYGVIAQELEKQHPEFVVTDEQGLKSVKYIDLLIAKIAELENRVKQLEN